MKTVRGEVSVLTFVSGPFGHGRVGCVAVLALLASVAVTGCKHRRERAQNVMHLQAESATVATSPIGPPSHSPEVHTLAPAPAAPWCAMALPTVDARAIDRRGHVVALKDETLWDETSGTLVARVHGEPACPTVRNHLGFQRDGSGVAFAHGRLFVHPRDGVAWTYTPVCSDVGGEPWTARPGGAGWAMLGRRSEGRELALLLTEDPTGTAGWYALTALDRRISAASLVGNGSMVALEAGGHAVFVDRESHVAGEVIAASDALWTAITRSFSGIAIARDVSPDAREIVTGSGEGWLFERQRRARPSGSHSERVFVLDFGRLLAVTDIGIEWSGVRGHAFVAGRAMAAIAGRSGRPRKRRSGLARIGNSRNRHDKRNHCAHVSDPSPVCHASTGRRTQHAQLVSA